MDHWRKQAWGNKFFAFFCSNIWFVFFFATAGHFSPEEEPGGKVDNLDATEDGEACEKNSVTTSQSFEIGQTCLHLWRVPLFLQSGPAGQLGSPWCKDEKFKEQFKFQATLTSFSTWSKVEVQRRCAPLEASNLSWRLGHRKRGLINVIVKDWTHCNSEKPRQCGCSEYLNPKGPWISHTLLSYAETFC